jgi:hypothetical protein
MSDQVPFQIIKSIEQTFKEYSSSYDAKIKDCLRRGKITEINFIESEIKLFELCLHDLENMSASLEGFHQLDSQTFGALAKIIQFTDYREFVTGSNKKIAFLKDKIHMLTKDEQKPSKKTIKTENIGKTKGDASTDSDQPLNDNLHKSVPYFLPEYRTLLLEILKSHFNSDQHEDLSKLITDPHQKSPILTFLGNGNKLPDAFKKLIQENIITQCNKKELEAWISKNFRYFSNMQFQNYTLKYLNDIISTQSDKCKTPILKISSSNGGSEKLLRKT